MALFLAVLGGAAVAEVHRALTGSRDKDINIIRQREEALKKQLQEIQRELTQAKSQRELTAQEAAQLAAINSELQKTKEDLEKETESLKIEKKDLEAREARLLEREQLLEQCTESLKLENSILIQQFEKLKIKHEQETLAFTEQLNKLKEGVATILQKFTAGEFDASQLIHTLAELGVQLQCSEQDMERLQRVAAKETTAQQRTEALQSVELKVEDSWFNQMRLVTSSQALAARLMVQGVSRSAANTPRAIVTPRSLEIAEQKAAAMKLASHQESMEEEVSVVDTIPAVHASAATVQGGRVKNNDNDASTTETRSLVFRPIKKAISKAVKNRNKQALVEVDVPVPRLSLDELKEGPSGTLSMAM